MTTGTRLLIAGLPVLLLATAATAQIPRSKIYSEPTVPPDDALRRLNLKLAWHRYVPTEGRKDGLATVQLAGKDLLVQTRSGLIVRMDAETGVIHWRQRVGKAYAVTQGLAFNTRSVFAVNGLFLFSLDRATGRQRWRFGLPNAASGLPVADDQQLYLPSNIGRLYAYHLPAADSLGGLDESGERARAYGEAERAGEPALNWSVLTNIDLEGVPLQTRSRVLVVSPAGEGRAYEKAESTLGVTALLARFTLSGRTQVPAGQFGDFAYIGTLDGNLYAYDIEAGRVVWRYASGSPVIRRPAPLADDVFVTLARRGLFRVSRVERVDEHTKRVVEGGQELWHNAEGDRFLAANRKFVYATDSSGRLLVLDRRRGTTLSRYDTRHFRFPIPNTQTDRLYLGAHNGLILCLHDRDLPRPYLHRAEDDPAAVLAKKLKTLRVTIPAGKPQPLRQALVELERKALPEKRPVELFRVAEAAFKEAGFDNIQARLVTFPKVDKRPLEEVLKLILDQVNATFDIVGEQILILPKPRK
jgi:outer membrane protein assembly factor BamB